VPAGQLVTGQEDRQQPAAITSLTGPAADYGRAELWAVTPHPSEAPQVTLADRRPRSGVASAFDYQKCPQGAPPPPCSD
jgi:hypothetical protein